MGMLLESGSTGSFVSAQTCTLLGLYIQEEPEKEELQLADGSPVPTQGRFKLHTEFGQYKNVVRARMFPQM